MEDNRYSEVAAEFEDLDAWERFLAYRDGQIRELTGRYRPDLMWFDGEWDRSEEQWRIPELAALIRSEVPDVRGGGRFRHPRIDPRSRHRNAPCRGSPGSLESMS
ncbi:hypothetical protein HDC93_000340 [Streptomyces sp. AK010]|nr:hypothetical protein [Streptomyces sp. AK010]